ncbi:hypothetical protein MTP04_29290 [Lysinibacillus sp. PLM2]|nr:hypothetical protein MTP04_29290 [Lysinibacillus sp. PLM2]
MKSAREILGENLLKMLNEKGIDQSVLADYLGVSNASVTYWIKGEKYPRIDKIQKIADFFNIPKSHLTEEQQSNRIETRSNVMKVPILGTIRNGEPTLVEENYYGYKYELIDSLPNRNVFYFQATEDSMEPSIPKNSFVLIKEQSEVQNGEIAAVRMNNNSEITLKRVKYQGDVLFLIPDNPKYEPIIINKKDQVTILGKAIKYTLDL